jgi:DNA-binding CsgD family transcriptional regulator
MSLSEIRKIFRLIGEIREMGADPDRWRPHMVRRLRKIFGAAIVVSSEVHLRQPEVITDANRRLMRIIDIGWGCDGREESDIWRIRNDTEGPPEAYMVASVDTEGPSATAARPTINIREGKSFILSQYPLPHIGAVDQLGLHQTFGNAPFTAAQQRLVRVFHLELGRLWKKEALAKAADPATELAPRLAQTLAALKDGCSEKQVSLRLGISQHTVHNYVKALHQRFGVNSRGELLAKVSTQPEGFVPKFSVEMK